MKKDKAPKQTKPGRKDHTRAEIKALAELVRGIRVARNMSQQELATALGKGWATVQRWETGKAFPEAAAYRILRAMGGIGA